ncbi:MAG: hypothetical protein MUF21_11430 [Gemmatimonadaceae bacterium]|nr:hypothetical protein [Gemmatimonadaceae bacterium]
MGQARTGWPFVEQMAVLRRTQLQHVTSATYLGGQALMLGPAVLLALAGAWATLRGRRASLAHVRLAAAGGGTLDGDASAARLVAAMRVTGTFAALLVSWYLVMHGKEYYAGPAYPMLLASGAAWLQRVTVTMRAPGTRTRRLLGRELTLPQDYADMLGWRAQVEAVARVVRALPADDRRRVLIGASNYGQASALAMHGPSRGLPYPVSTAGDFWRWGHGDNDGNVVLTVETLESRAGLTEAWHEVREVGRLVDPRRVEEERDVRIMLMRGIRIPLPELWRRSGPGWG